jgi:uncharacterized protein YbaR (Trm112 family)
MVLDDLLLELLVCPIDRTTRLVPANRRVLTALNRQIVKGQILDRAGNPVDRILDKGLIREDGKFLYRVDEDIPLLTVGSAIPLARKGEA